MTKYHPLYKTEINWTEEEGFDDIENRFNLIPICAKLLIKLIGIIYQ